jgi:cysteinyl-tRNA synthetase
MQPSPLFDTFPLTIYNSLVRQKEAFQPLAPPSVGLYVCGPTMYGDPHLGHARSAVAYDTVFRYLQTLGYRVRYVRNITDVGHLENEVEELGEDKVSKKAKAEQLEPMEVVQMYTYHYRDALRQLNTLPPSIEPTASGHIPEQIATIRKIIDHGYAYEVNGSVYFDLDKYAQEGSYGQLSGKVLDELRTGSRQTEGLDEKRSPHDFALWKKAYPQHIMRWSSPWGDGFPGWHLECTAMSTKYLGKTFDIHGGGIDLQFPHHEAEIAQSQAAFRAHPARYWMHNNMVTVDGQKMSKSLNNFITLEEVFSGEHERLNQAYSPMMVRFFMLQAHYRSPLDFSNEALQAAEKGLKRLLSARKLVAELTHQPGLVDEATDQQIYTLSETCYQQMSDDFGTPQVIATLFDLSAKINQMHHRQLSVTERTFRHLQETFISFVDDVLGLVSEKKDDTQLTDSLVQLLINTRRQAREKKDFATSDQIRDQLAAMGVLLKDEKSGETTYTLS